jgi:hypothetical protein
MSGAGPSLDPGVSSSGTGVGRSSAQPPAPAGSTGSTRTTAAASGAKPPENRPRVARTHVNDAQREWVIAVMTAASSGKSPFDRSMLGALTDQIRVYIAERGARVVDRSTQEAALKGLVEQEKKRSYAACVDSSCQIPLGKALAASHILRSTVAKFGKACATNGELIDLKAEVTVAAGSARSDCSEEDLLYAAESLAEQLIAGSAAKAK